MYCGFCANPILQGKKYCSKDGKPLGEGTTFCIDCGKPLKPGTKFCGACGYRVGSFGQPSKTKSGQCSNCLTQNEAGVKSCVVCGKPLANPLTFPTEKQPQQQRQIPPVKTVAGQPPQSSQQSPVRQNVQINNAPQATKPPISVSAQQQIQAMPESTTQSQQQISAPVQQIQQAMSTTAQTTTNADGGGNHKPERYSSIVDNKGRATIPKQVRELLGIKTAGTVVFTVEGGKVTFTASKSRKAGKNGS